MVNKWLLLLLLMVPQIVVKCNNDSLKVCLAQLGCLQGTKVSDNFEAFLGVPYAQPPVAALRFRNPQPVQPWHGVLSAGTAKADCLQKNFLQPNWPITGAEDCLYLNVYRPQGVAESTKLPVIFYIYGGGLFSGSAHPAVMGPDYFMNTGEVIVVTVNYRLGPLGFLSSGDDAMPGNYGLKDQFMALKWVNEHIAAFGGDPKEITLFGHSAGAGCVHYHMLNSKTKDLFKRSILSSGNALAPFMAIQDNPLQQTLQIASSVGIENPQNLSSHDLTEQLRKVDAKAMLEAGVALKFWSNHILFNYRPVLENPNLEHSYIVEHPWESIRKGNFVLKPWLTGLVSYAGESAAISLNIYDNQTLRGELNGNFSEIMYQLMAFSANMGTMEKEKILLEFVDEYMQGMHELNAQTADGFQELFSDYYFYYPLYSALRYYMDYADVASNPVYIYKFSYHGPYTYVPFYTGGSTNRYDVVHFDDLLYQFRQTALFPDFERNSPDWRLSGEFVKMLVDFAKTGKPLDYDTIGTCDRDRFFSNNTEGFCHYLEFINADKGYAKRSNNEFNVRRMHLWDRFFKSI